MWSIRVVVNQSIVFLLVFFFNLLFITSAGAASNPPPPPPPQDVGYYCAEPCGGEYSYSEGTYDSPYDAPYYSQGTYYDYAQGYYYAESYYNVQAYYYTESYYQSYYQSTYADGAYDATYDGTYPTPTPTPGGPTPTPTPASYTISGRVWVDTNSNGSQNCSGACDNGAGDELNYQGATLTRSAPGPDPTTTTNASGNYTFASVTSGTYNITLTLPSGYIMTNGSSTKQRSVGPNATANFGIREASCVPGGATLSGKVYIDPSGGACGTSTTPYGAGATVTVRSGASITGSGSTDALGDYSVLDITACGQKTATLSNISSNYGVKCIRYDGGAWTSSGLSGFTYGPFNFSANHTLDWYLTNLTPWFYIGDGDVRSGNLVDTAPVGQVVSSSLTSVFFSSNFNASFGNGITPNWVVNNEYSYNDEPKTNQGLFSYSFFMNRTKIKGVTINNMPGCPTDGSPCTASLALLPTGVYRSAGDLTLTSYTHEPGAHVLLLINGTLTIQSNIKVPVGAANLLVVAAKNDINVDSSVGNTPPAAPCGTSACSNIEGIYTAEGSITLASLGNTCADGVTADKQFTLAGTFITNALRPFKVGGAGTFNNLRSLCAQDLSFPVFVIQSRYDFVPQLTDFYKLPSTRWREVNP